MTQPDQQPNSPPPDADDAETLHYLRQQLVENAVKLAESLQEAATDATFAQRATALNQLIDKIIKLADRIPRAAQREQVIRIEYLDPDGSIHQTPPYARAHSTHDDSVSGGGVRATLRQDGDGQNRAD